MMLLPTPPISTERRAVCSAPVLSVDGSSRAFSYEELLGLVQKKAEDA